MESESKIESKIEKLNDESQWSTWKFQVKITLIAAEVYEVVTGDEECPLSDNARIREWRRKDAKAQQIIGISVGSKHIIHIASCGSAKAMWSKLHQVFERKNETSLIMLHQQFFNFKKDPEENIISFIARLEELVLRLRDLNEKLSDDLVITKVILSLPSEYASFSSAWESASKPERTLDNLRARLVIEEERLISRGQVEPVEALVSKRTGGNKSNGRCFICGKNGHWKRNCPDRNAAKDLTALNSDACVFQVTKNSWILDSGASHHMTANREWFNTYQSEVRNVKIARGHIQAHGIGTILVKIFDGINWSNGVLKDVLFVPQIETNLFSQNHALDEGLIVEGNSKEVKFKRTTDNNTVVLGQRHGNLTIICIKVLVAEAKLATKENSSIQLWHEKLAHQNIEQIRNILKINNIKFTDDSFECDACVFGKQHRSSFQARETLSSKCGQLIHADVCGPMQVESIGGSRYFLILKDDFSHFRFVFFMKYKSEVYEKVKLFLKLAQNSYGHNVQVFRSDNGTEFINDKMKKLFETEGIRHQKTVPYNPQQNGSAEREMRTIMEAARTMIYSKNMDLKFWAEAVNTAVFVINRSGTSTIQQKTPYEIWTGKSSKIDFFLPFGCEVFSHIPKEKRSKLNAKSEKCIFVGYDENVKGYRVWNTNRNKIEYSRDVKFISSQPNVVNNDDTNKTLLSESTIITTVERSNESNKTNANIETDTQSSENDFDDASEDFTGNIVENSVPESVENCQNPNAERVHKQPREFYYLSESNIIESRLRNKPNQVDDASGFISLNLEEPTTYDDAMKSSNKDEWYAAMKDELKSLEDNNTWRLVDAPKGKKIVDNKWVFKIKYRLDGSVERFKARLVARGFTQEYGIDYEEVFSPVVKFTSIRVVLSLVAMYKMAVQQFDVKTAFLYGDLDKDVYMHQPYGFNDGTGKVCHLNKSLYGLKQASRCWNRKFTDFIKKYKLIQLESDPCVFTNEDKSIILALYVDDGLIAARSKDQITSVIAYLQTNFEIKFFKAECFLGLEIRCYEDGSIGLNQSNYAKKVLKRFKMDDCNGISTPMDANQVCENFGDSKISKFPFREAVGSLIYLSIATRPDISFAVGVASRFLENPNESHVNAVKRILKYIKSTLNFGIYFNGNCNIRLIGYSDADYAGDKETRRSTSGYVFLLGENIVSWGSERQKSVALSTTESEYIAASVAVKELIWLQHLIKELIDIGFTTEMNMDNQSSIRLIKNPEFHKRTKHIDVRYHFIRERYEENLFNLNYVSSDEQLADIFTKALPKSRFQLLRELISIKEKVEGHISNK